MKISTLLRGWLLSTLILTAALPGVALAAHAIAQFGAPKYPADFQHFDYANPNAPKGGGVNLSVVVANTGFDTFNPFLLKGKAAPGLLEMVFETLTINSLDEPNTQYGLLADDIEVAPDFTSATFHINAKARFSNGDPVTARDVKYSFDTLISRKASPRFKSYFSEIKELTVLDASTVRFTFTRPGRDLSFVAGSLPVFSPKWGEADDGAKTPFDQLRLETPIGTGPYTIEKRFNDLSLTYGRDPHYWAADLPVRRGAFNFNHVTYKIYKDRDTQVSALRAGDFDFSLENQMRYWCCQFIGKRFDSGEYIKAKFAKQNLAPMNAYIFNQRKERFQDIRVRKALSYAFDWNWTNEKILANEFERQDSYFGNSPLAAKGLPSPDELKLLEPYRAELPPEVFGPMLEQPTTRPPNSLRGNLAKAAALFEEAGWHFDETDGHLKNGKGETFTIEISGSSSVSMLLNSFYINIERLGVVLVEKSGDPTADRQKLRNFDFDFTSAAAREARDPAPELWRWFNSADANVPGSDNLTGVKSRVVDDLLKKLLDADSEEERETVAHALDRVLIHNYYVLPWRYLTHQYIIYNSRLGKPATLPLYYGANEWLLSAWWDRAAEAHEAHASNSAQ